MPNRASQSSLIAKAKLLIQIIARLSPVAMVDLANNALEAYRL